MFVVTFEDHPAREIVEGQAVPAVPDQRMIRVNGDHAGYCGIVAGAPVSMIRRYPADVMQEVVAAVAEAYGKPSVISMPPDLGAFEGWQ
tara:strand:- start:58 stop:324 length:267 start_codon:yes stop_codon:yes gene_type:complete